MKKIFIAVMLFLCLLMVCAVAFAEAIPPDTGGGMDPFTWAQLATIAGATAAVLLIVQFLKLPLDRVWKIPTRIIVYIIALAIMMIGVAFTSGLDVQTATLTAINAFIVALAAMGSYELTFAKLDDKKKHTEKEIFNE